MKRRKIKRKNKAFEKAKSFSKRKEKVRLKGNKKEEAKLRRSKAEGQNKHTKNKINADHLKKVKVKIEVKIKVIHKETQRQVEEKDRNIEANKCLMVISFTNLDKMELDDAPISSRIRSHQKKDNSETNKRSKRT